MINDDPKIDISLTISQIENLLDDVEEMIDKHVDRIDELNEEIKENEDDEDDLLASDLEDTQNLLLMYQAIRTTLIAALRTHNPNHPIFKGEPR